ncbi:DUF4136 domain-containing protein [Sphingomonas nostoxanthinifaciens]|uniref:DUF4136 domain-containing protein n=1 Tax=Sphingomonas nostoxanthinifaciens TaxID=2872652 RepID=UPI001CC1C722|nr:DUF4136 domain-containing protein [Sphingomonas nostoxanthinifaciens]UAK25335.1 DUF4136 domain-containing protein [Sphingomonas nostoxanthinifaciens]
MGRIRIALGIAGLALLAGCASSPETRVTRFHLNAPIATGQIAVEPLVPSDKGSVEFQSYADIVGRELAKLGFTEAPGLRASEQVAVISVERGTREAMRRSGLSIGLGGGSYGRGGGVGGGVTVPVGHSTNEIVVTKMVVQIKRRSDATVIWEGRAETAAPVASADAQPTAAVTRLAAALFKGFPGVSGDTITVK